MRKTVILLILMLIFITAYNVQAGHLKTYTVKTGDTLWGISQKLGISVEDIIKQNKIRNPQSIYVGQRLSISNIQNTSNRYSFYRVRSGDTLWILSQRFNTTVEKIISLNSLQSPYYLYIGQRIILPNYNTKQNYVYYTIKNGDILWNISQRYNTTIRDIVRINNLNNYNDLYIGKRIIIPRTNYLNTKYVNKEVKTYRVKSGGEYIFDIASNHGISIKSLLNVNNLRDPNRMLRSGTLIFIPLDEESKATWIEYENGKPKNSLFS